MRESDEVIIKDLLRKIAAPLCVTYGRLPVSYDLYLHDERVKEGVSGSELISLLRSREELQALLSIQSPSSNCRL